MNTCIVYFGIIIFEPLCSGKRWGKARERRNCFYSQCDRALQLPLHAAFKMPLRAAAAGMNQTMEYICINKLFLLVQASRRRVTLQSGEKIIKYIMQMN